MKYSAKITINADVLDLFEEDKSNRSVTKIHITNEGHTEFNIESKDSVALRATLNSITKLFTAYENIENGTTRKNK